MFTIDSFCNHVWNMSYSKVLRSIDKECYKTFDIPKKNGIRKIRCLESGCEMDSLQLMLNTYLQNIPLPICVKGFKKGSSYNAYLSEHIGSQFFLRTDIKDFFPSICEASIKQELPLFIPIIDKKEKEKVVDLIYDIVTINGELPQGARTSPVISNIVMIRMDQRITKYCQLFGIRYTRYADDMLFSSSTFNFKEKTWFIKKVKYILLSLNFQLNYSKLKFGHHEMILNGYVISKDGIRLSRSRLTDIRHVIATVNRSLYIIESEGEDKFLKEINRNVLKHRDLALYPFKSIFQLSQYLVGYRSYLISMYDPHSSSSFQRELQRIIRRIEKQIDCII